MVGLLVVVRVGGVGISDFRVFLGYRLEVISVFDILL